MMILGVESLEGKKISLEPDLNQWPKDVCNLSFTVLRSTNWAIEGLLCLLHFKPCFKVRVRPGQRYCINAFWCATKQNPQNISTLVLYMSHSQKFIEPVEGIDSRRLVGSTNQACSTSELLENQRNALLFFEIVPCHFCEASEVQT